MTDEEKIVDVVQLSDKQLLDTINEVNKDTEDLFEEVVASDAAKEGFRLVERTEMYINRTGGYYILARFENSEGENVVTMSNFDGILHYQKGDFDLCKGVFEKGKQESAKYIGTMDGKTTADAMAIRLGTAPESVKEKYRKV